MKKITDEDLLNDLIRVKSLMGKVPTGAEYEKHGKYSVRPFKSRKKWNEWLVEAFGEVVVEKNKYKLRNPSFSELKKDLERLSFLGYKPRRSDYDRYGIYLVDDYYEYMNWTEWQDLCFPNLERTNSMRVRFTEEQLVEELIKVNDIIGSPPSISEFRKNSKILVRNYLEIKPWIDWLKDIFNYDKNRGGNKITNEELIENLIEMKEKLGRLPKIKDMNLASGSKYSMNAYKRAFGSLGAALEKANLKIKLLVPSAKEIINSIKFLYNKLNNYTPTLEEYFEEYPDHRYYHIKDHFGSWTKALLAANIPVEKAGKVSKEDAIKALQKWYNENNQDTSCLEYWRIRKARQKRMFPYTCETISKKFNFISWEDIMKQIDPNYETKDQFACRSKFLGNDGNEYLSSIEKQVADILFDLKTAGKIKKYEYEVPVAPNKNWTCDFVINNEIWLEVDGMRGSRKDPYGSGNEKIEYYKDNKIKHKIVSYGNINIEKLINEVI